MEAKDKLREWLLKKGYDGAILGRRDNYAWLSGGARNDVLSCQETGIAYYVINQEDILLFADSSDLNRMSAEQDPLEARARLVPWYESVETAIRDHIGGKNYVSDTGIAGTRNVQEELIDLRLLLSETELARYREIGALCAEIVEDICRKAVPGDTESGIACRLKCRCLENGISPDCVLVGADERILSYRHPVPTGKKAKDCLMVVLGGEKYGLNVSITRMVYFSPVPPEIAARYEKTRYIFACMQGMMKDGLAYGDYFSEIQRLYREAGYENEWKLHHQGGPTGYACREFIAVPGMKKLIRSGQAYAWNPTIQGTKCEETTFLRNDGTEILTKTQTWPRTEIRTPYGAFEAADIYCKNCRISNRFIASPSS